MMPLVTLGTSFPENPPIVAVQSLISILPDDSFMPETLITNFGQPYSPNFTPSQFAKFVRFEEF
jgi:hypothetical protein